MKRHYQHVLKSLIDHFRPVQEITSAYAYGSTVGNRATSKSDLDILFIVQDVDNPRQLITRIKKMRDSFSAIRLDISLVFASEFRHRWHIYRPASFFLGVKYQHLRLWGPDLLADVKKKEFTRKHMYKRVVDLAQSSRGIYMNGKNNEVWEKKYVRWLQVAALEILFLEGTFELNYRRGIQKLVARHSELRALKMLYRSRLSMSQTNAIAEMLRQYLRQGKI